jgi:hypothetical protein
MVESCSEIRNLKFELVTRTANANHHRVFTPLYKIENNSISSKLSLTCQAHRSAVVALSENGTIIFDTVVGIAAQISYFQFDTTILDY